MTAPSRHTETPRDSLSSLGASLDRMIATQMTAYPSSWSDADKREMAEQHLFGIVEGGMLS